MICGCLIMVKQVRYHNKIIVTDIFKALQKLFGALYFLVLQTHIYYFLFITKQKNYEKSIIFNVDINPGSIICTAVDE